MAETEEKTIVYLPENPKQLLNMALDSIGQFDDNMSDIEVDYIAITPDGSIPSRLSLAGAILFDEYETLDIFARATGHQGVLMISLDNENDFYNSHVRFVDAFVKFDIDAIMAFLNPRCVMKIDKLPYAVDFDAPNTPEGMVTCYIRHEALDEGIKDYVKYRVLQGEDYNNYLEVDDLSIVINRIVKMEKLLEDFFIYVPT